MVCSLVMLLVVLVEGVVSSGIEIACFAFDCFMLLQFALCLLPSL